MAIAIDGTAQAQFTTTTSSSVSLTTSGSDRILIGAISLLNSGVSNVAMTYNGVSMTQIGTKTVGGAANVDVYLFYLIAPATGANTFAASWTGNSSGSIFGASYTGAKQTGQPDSSATGNTTDGSTHIAVATTVVASNCWLVGIYRMDSNLSVSYDSGTTARVVYQPNNFQGQGILDSNGTVSTGSQSLGVTVGEAGIVGAMVVASIAPATVSVNTTNFFAMM